MHTGKTATYNDFLLGDLDITVAECNAKPAEGALTRVLTVLHSLYFYTHFLFVAFISMLAGWACAKYCQFTCLTERYFLIFSAWLLCMILPSSLFIDYLDCPLCFGYLIGLTFLLRPIACLLTLAFWISPLYYDRSDCYFGFDPLPAFSYVFVVTAFNKLPHMDSHSASASSLHRVKRMIFVFQM